MVANILPQPQVTPKVLFVEIGELVKVENLRCPLEFCPRAQVGTQGGPHPVVVWEKGVIIVFLDRSLNVKLGSNI